MPNEIDPIGRRIGRLTVVRYIGKTGPRRWRTWLCRCDCGGENTLTVGAISSGDIRSCGCLRRETTARTAKARAAVVEISGERATLREWAAIAGIGYGTIALRYKRGVRGEALIAPVVRRGKSPVELELA